MKIIYIVVLLLSGCAVTPSQSDLNRADFGSPVSQASVEQMVKSGLKDPYSAHVSCSIPAKGYGNRFSGAFGTNIYGYISICSINAKNGFGAYTGEKTQVFCVTNDAGFGEKGLIEMFGKWKFI